MVFLMIHSRSDDNETSSATHQPSLSHCAYIQAGDKPLHIPKVNRYVDSLAVFVVLRNLLDEVAVGWSDCRHYR